MYAVIKVGGKQQKVKAGDVIEVELMHGGQGDGITFTPILLVDDDGKTHVGKDLGKAVVKAKLVGEQKGEKTKIFKYRPKTGYSRRQGHRQMYTLLEVTDIALGKPAISPKKAASEPAQKAKDPKEPKESKEPASAPTEAPVESTETPAKSTEAADKSTEAEPAAAQAAEPESTETS